MMMTENTQNHISKLNAKNCDLTWQNSELINIFLDNGSNQLEDQFFLSRKKMLNAQKGKNELFTMLQMKWKGLDMLLSLWQSNKSIGENEDLYCVEILHNLITVAKNEKTWYTPILKKVRTITCYLIKNQISMNNESNYRSLAKFVILLLNISYENPFYQQIVDLIIPEKALLEIFIEELFGKLFTSRNINIRMNNMKFIFRYLTSNKHIQSLDIVLKLINMLKTRTEGGARTSHQLTQVCYLITYLLDIFVSKGEIKELINESDLCEIWKKIFESIQDQLSETLDKEENKKGKQPSDKKGEDKESLKMKRVIFIEILKVITRIENILEKKKIEIKTKKVEIEKLKTKWHELYDKEINVKYGLGKAKAAEKKEEEK